MGTLDAPATERTVTSGGEDVLRGATADGLTFALSADGRIRLAGQEEAFGRWKGEIASRKPEVVSALSRWRVLDGHRVATVESVGRNHILFRDEDRKLWRYMPSWERAWLFEVAIGESSGMVQ